MDEKSSTRAAIYAVAVMLMAAYIVFVMTRMARTDGAKQTLLVLGIALAAGALAAGAGLATRRRS